MCIRDSLELLQTNAVEMDVYPWKSMEIDAKYIEICGNLRKSLISIENVRKCGESNGNMEIERNLWKSSKSIEIYWRSRGSMETSTD